MIELICKIGKDEIKEEVKKKNKRIFYLMLGLSILLIGGLTVTFAYFSASKSNTGTITGTTNNTNGTLTINVSRLGLNPSPAPTSDDLVPADFGVTPNNITTTLVNAALTSITIGNTSASIGACAFGENHPLSEPFASNYSCETFNPGRP